MTIALTVDDEDEAPERQLVTRSEYARMRGLAYDSVRQAVLDGRVPIHGRNKIDVEEADRAWAANTDPRKGGGAALSRSGDGDGEAKPRGGGGSPGRLVRGGQVTYNAVRTQHEQLRLELAQMEADERRGVTVRVEEVRRGGLEAGQRVKEAVMRVPAQLAAAMAAATAPGECRRMMEESLREALRGAIEVPRGT